MKSPSSRLALLFTAMILIILLTAAGCADTGTPNNIGEGKTTGTAGNSSDGGALQVTDEAGVPETITDNDPSDEWTNFGAITLGNTIKYVGTGISAEGSIVTITQAGDYTLTGTLTDGRIVVDAEGKVKLRLAGVDITSSDGPAIFFLQSKKSFVTISDGTVNSLTDGNFYSVEAKGTIFSNDTLEIKGGGTLNVTGNYGHGIVSDDDIIIENGIINITAKTDGLHANDNITVTGGNINISADSDGFGSEGDMVISGGKIDITGSEEGIEGKTVIDISGGEISIQCSDDGLNAGDSLYFRAGYLYIDCNGDGIDSNGTMTIDGGLVNVFSGDNANGPLDTGDRGGTFIINNGTVVATGGNMGIGVDENSAQYSLWLGVNLAKGDKVTVNDSKGTVIISFDAPKSASLTYLSTPLLKADQIYTIYINGSEQGSVTMSAKSESFGQVSEGFGGRGGMGGFGGQRR